MRKIINLILGTLIALLKIINLILGTLIALLAGCKAQQQSVKQENRAVMYGPPAYFQERGK